MEAANEMLQKSCLWRTVNLIFVTVGTSHLAFDRLLRAADILARDWDERFVIQTGHSIYEPKYADWFRFKDNSGIVDLIREAEIVIAHGGFGIIGKCIREKKKIIIVPRQKRYKEAVNPQNELAEYLSQEESIISLRNTNELGKAISNLEDKQVCYHFKTDIPELIKNFVETKLFS